LQRTSVTVTRGGLAVAATPRPVDVADEGEEVEVEADLALHLAELVRVPRPRQAAVRVPAPLAGPHQQVGAPERLLQGLHGAARLRVPQQPRVVVVAQPPEQAADHLHAPGQLPAHGAVPPRRLRRVRDHRDEAERVHAHQLRHRRHLPDQSHYRYRPSFLLACFRPSFLLACFGPVVVRNKTGVVNDRMSALKKDTKVWEWQRKSKILTCTCVEAHMVEQTRGGGAVSRKLQACTQYQ
jgi:hypothetical protein